MNYRILSVACAAVLSMTTPALSVAVSGGVTSTTRVGSVSTTPGAFVKLNVPFTESDPDSTVGNDTLQDNNLYAFDEDQNINLLSDLLVDVGATIMAGQTVASHYIFFDPDQNHIIEGFVDFDSAVLGIATSRSNLLASDTLLNNGVTYLSPNARGLENASQQSAIGIDDEVSISLSNPNRIELTLGAGTPGDYIRVFTEFSPTAAIPLPATAWLLLAAFGGLGAVSRLSRKRMVV